MKMEFYIYQEDLIKYNVCDSNVSITEFVQRLNKTFCIEDMKKLRAEQIIDYLVKEGFLERNADKTKIPSTKGKLMGIGTEERIGKDGEIYKVITYTPKGQLYILDKIYKII